jgi:phospholipid transport system substrate-binding protein
MRMRTKLWSVILRIGPMRQRPNLLNVMTLKMKATMEARRFAPAKRQLPVIGQGSWYIVAALVLALVWHPLLAAAASPGEEVRASVEKFLAIVKDPGLRNKTNERREKIKDVIRERFDFTEMARRSLGPEWRRHGPEEQKEFVQLFTDLLERAYIRTVEDVRDVRYRSERVDGDYAEVRTQITDSKGTDFEVDYRLHNAGGDWKVYDVVVDNISLVNNYRDQFRRVVSKYSYEELIRRMKAKLIEDDGKVAGKPATD